MRHQELQLFVQAQLCLEIISQESQSTSGQDPAGATPGSMRKFPLLSAPGVPTTAFVLCPEKPPALLGEDVQIGPQNGYSPPVANLLFPLQPLLCSPAQVSQKGACAFLKAAPKL